MISAFRYAQMNCWNPPSVSAGNRAASFPCTPWVPEPLTAWVRRAAGETSWTEEGIPYVRVEHVTLPSEESMRLAAEHGIAFVTQPIFPYAETASYLANLGPERLKQCYPVKTILDRGVTLGFSTDAPATFWAVPSDPFPGLKLAVTRRAAERDRLRSRSGGDGGDSHTAVYQRGGPGCRDERLRNAGGGIPGGFRGAQRRYF